MREASEINNLSIHHRLQAVLAWLVEPSAKILNREDKQRAKLLSGIYLSTIATVTFILSYVVYLDSNDLFKPITIGGIIANVIFLCFFVLNRIGFLRIAAIGLIAVMFVLSVLMPFLTNTAPEVLVLALIPILLTGIFFSLRALTTISIIIIAAIYIQNHAAGEEFRYFWRIQVIWYALLFCVALIITFIRHLTRLEHLRRQQLEEANHKLRLSEASLEKRVHDRTLDLQLVGEISRKITTTLNIDDLLPQITKMTLAAFKLYYVAIFLYDDTNKELRFAVGSGETGEKIAKYNMKFSIDEEQLLIAKAGRELDVVLINNTLEAPNFRNSPYLLDTRSEISLPMVVGEELMGVLDLQAVEIDRFSEDDIRLLSNLAEQIAIAVRNSQTFEREQHLKHETNILYRLGHELNSATSFVDVVRMIADVLEVNYDVYIACFDKQSSRYAAYLARYNYSENKAENIDKIPSISAPHIPRGVVQSFDTLGQLGDYPMVQDFVRELYIQSGLGVGLWLENHYIGLLYFFSEDTHTFSSEDQDLLVGLSDVVTATVERIRLTDAAQKQAKLLYEVGQRLNSVSDIQGVVNVVSDVLNADYIVGLTLYDTYDYQSATQVREWIVLENSDVLSRQRHLEKGMYLFDLHREMIIANDLDDLAMYPQTYQLLKALNTQSGIGLPLWLEDRCMGACYLLSAKSGRVSLAYQDLIRNLGETIAATIERIRLFQEQVQIAERLRELDALKSQFLASMSHELRTPLNAILNFTEIVLLEKLGPLAERQKSVLQKSLDSSRHLLDLINDVLDMTKIEAGMMELFIEADIDLYQELNTVIAATETLLDGKSVELLQDIDTDLPKIVADRRRIRQIMLNLLSNAVKFTRDGTITLSVKHKSDNSLLFAVLDTGPGIPQEQQDIIFNPFFQTETGVKHANGTGLGLPISLRLAEAHGGRLWLESIVGEGAAFYFSLPLTNHQLEPEV